MTERRRSTSRPKRTSGAQRRRPPLSRRAVFVRDGGTIGAMTSIEKVLRCPVLFLGLSLPEHGYHAPNENFDWQQASGGMVAFAKYFEEIANL